MCYKSQKFARVVHTEPSFCILICLFQDKKDLEKVGAAPLEENNPADEFIYEIMVYTGFQPNSGTKSNVSIFEIYLSSLDGYVKTFCLRRLARTQLWAIIFLLS